MANISINELSQTISELIDLDRDQQSLIESAVNRAISAKDITGGRHYSPKSRTPVCQPIINGKVACPPPKPEPMVAGFVGPPLINGTMIASNPEPTIDPPLINGLIVKPTPC